MMRIKRISTQVILPWFCVLEFYISVNSSFITHLNIKNDYKTKKMNVFPKPNLKIFYAAPGELSALSLTYNTTISFYLPIMQVFIKKAVAFSAKSIFWNLSYLIILSKYENFNTKFYFEYPFSYLTIENKSCECYWF